MSKESDYPLLLSICVGTLVKDISNYGSEEDAPERAAKLLELIATVQKKEAKTSFTLRDLREEQIEDITIELANMTAITLSELDDHDLADFNHFVDLVIRATASLSGAAAFLASVRDK